MNRTDYDAVVVGAGPAGSTAAILLATAGWSVALIEKQRFPRRKVCGECIAAGSIPLLTALGIGEAFAQLAGAQLRQVALYCEDRVAYAALPPIPRAVHPWGRALGRETLDRLLLERARSLGVQVWQPCSLRAVTGQAGGFVCDVEMRPGEGRAGLRTPVLIMANGSWQSQAEADGPTPRKKSDLLAFKANFSGANLAPGTLPILSFAGGYGGLVVADGDLVTLAGCIRRDRLLGCRAAAPGMSAGGAFEHHLRTSVVGVRDALDGATRVGAWLGAGPLQPGIRTPWRRSDGAFLVGNAAAEAHPIIGEGINMAIQSAWILCSRLTASGQSTSTNVALRRAGADYAGHWRHAFAPRLRVAASLAHLAMRPALAPLVWPLIARAPRILTAIARHAGKDRIDVDPLTIPRSMPALGRAAPPYTGTTMETLN